MSFERKIPSKVSELMDYLTKIFENRTHVKSVQVNDKTGHIEVALDFFAHHNPTGDNYPDVYMPVKEGKIPEAKKLVDEMWKLAKAGTPPTMRDAQMLFDLIDQGGK